MEMSRSTKRIFHQIRQFSHFLRISPLVQEALRNGKGVVALESTVITHGLPYPHNLKTAQELEEQVKSSGSQPATIALIDGNIHVGLDDSQLEQVATTKNAVKVSTRDIAKTLVRKELGGTTVAATMRIAHAAGIQFFATGGIGGVHRGAEQTFDISADLQELARTPVCVVCSGVKSILDIPKTIEYLETNSVNCVVFGKENIFPSFFTSKSESEGQFCTTCFDEIIALQETSAQLGFSAGTLLACPIPEKFAADGQVIQTAIDQALKEAKDQNVNSQRVTPFILARVNELTKGASMKTNIALLKNNAKIAGELANRKANSNKGTPAQNFSRDSENKKNETNLKVPRIVSIGASIVDFEAVTEEDVKNDGGSYVGQLFQRCGGVARNHADAIARLGCESVLISAVGEDDHGDYLRQQCSHIDISGVVSISNASTATYMSMNQKGNVRYGVSSIGKVLSLITPEMITQKEKVIGTADFLLLDSNLSVETMKKAIEIGSYYKRKIWVEPTDIKKMNRVFKTGLVRQITATSPNANEFRMWAQECGVQTTDKALSSPETVADFVLGNKVLLQDLSFLVVSLAEKGSVVVSKNEKEEYELRLVPAPVDSTKVFSVSGAGDSFNSGVMCALASGKTVDEALEVGQICAALTLQTPLAVSTSITPKILFD